MPRITLKQLEVFVCTAQEGSIQKASERIHLTQSATSMAMADLERLLGRTLFDRIGRRLRLNSMGQTLLPMAADILARTHELERMANTQGVAQGQLVIGASQTVGTYLLPALMGHYLQQHPDIQLKLQVDNTQGVIHSLEKMTCDLGFIEGYCQSNDVETLPWCEDELIIFCGPGHPLAREPMVTLPALGQASWVLREIGSGTREVFNNALQGKVNPIHVALELSQTEAIKQVVHNGFGLGCLSRLSINAEIERGWLIPLSVPELDLKRQLMAAIHRRKFQDPLLKDFLNFCQKNQCPA